MVDSTSAAKRRPANNTIEFGFYLRLTYDCDSNQMHKQKNIVRLDIIDSQMPVEFMADAMI